MPVCSPRSLCKPTTRTGIIWILAILSLFPFEASAVRPFVTDDARISDYGQVEIESWMDETHSHGEFGESPGINGMVGVSPSDWFQLIAGTGLDRTSNGRWAVANPVVQGKMLMNRATVDGLPGFAVATGATFNVGQGSIAAGAFVDESMNKYYRLGDNYYAISMMTARILEDRINIHVNLGLRGQTQTYVGTRLRPYWGVGMDAEFLREDIRAIAETYAGDPLMYNAPYYAGQFGFRWLFADDVNFDVTFGAEPVMNEAFKTTSHVEVWGQVGMRLLFDVFTRDGAHGNPEGGRGLFHVAE
jgi:hypothetical protein